MKRAATTVLNLFLGTGLLVLVGTTTIEVAGQSEATLYSVLKYKERNRPRCLSFEKGPMATSEGPCDLFYGYLYAGNEMDWFQSSTAKGKRSVIRDLGEQLWTDNFKVPVVAALPKLKPGEQRQVTVDTSGADGADGVPGAPGLSGDAIARAGDTPAAQLERLRTETQMRPQPTRPKRDGKPKIDPLFVKSVVGHMYVIHVVDDVSDFYALFRVEALQRGDSCTISWKLIEAPESNEDRAKVK